MVVKKPTPFERAQLVYESEPCVRSFFEDLLQHLQSGYVFSVPEAIVYGRPVDRHAPIEEIRDPSIQFKNPNAWWVWMASGEGSLAVFLRFEPFQLPYVGFERHNTPRFYRREALINHVQRANSLRDGLL